MRVVGFIVLVLVVASIADGGLNMFSGSSTSDSDPGSSSPSPVESYDDFDSGGGGSYDDYRGGGSYDDYSAGDLDCSDMGGSNIPVGPDDPHGLDADGDGIGCED